MHIPDGFLSPQTYLPAYAAAAVAWWATGRGLRARLDDTLVPRLAALTALVYAIGLVMLPLPGGTSVHAVGVALLALCFDARLAFLGYSLVLLLQSLLFGAGGITALPVNALAIGGAGALVTLAVFRALRGWNETAAVLLATWCAVMASAALVGLVLGLQPWLAHRADGTPLYFPFGLPVVLPAVLAPHALLGVGEAVLTLLVWRIVRMRRWEWSA
ncbi:energy-coupling factor ABC transporter permease [Pseudorhodoferax sp. Leaf265]|uniref:energy-coupling factor ABC transporter permease n=1 Tax=Pseudorhodoferax sp. Leaf265 TaxID=1736315 RepID=UPI0006FAAC28|nr:energy-coupling factor ABC transporter permease [Pseudorhodoferax sp. Leaf265]KQP21298.1 cobalamin biosynthesis protein CbiM [Pseudorhodoferax sp. Leaf265]